MDASELLLMAVGMTFVIITAGIDLSVGAVLVLSSVLAAKTMVALSGTSQQVQNYQFPHEGTGIPVGIAVGLLVGLACGLINGLVVTRLKLTPFIATLGSLGLFLGTAQILSGGVNVPYVPPAVQSQIGTRNLFGFLPVPIAVAVVVVIVGGAGVALDTLRTLHLRRRFKRRSGPESRHQRRRSYPESLRTERVPVRASRGHRPRQVQHRFGWGAHSGQPDTSYPPW